jgi:hypothetical protein
MRFISKTSLRGVTEQLFILDEIPGVPWTPEDAHGTRPLILMGHGGGQHKKAPGILARAHHFAAEGGFAVAAIDVPNHGEWSTDEEFDRIATEYRARMAAGEDTAALDTAMYIPAGACAAPGCRAACGTARPAAPFSERCRHTMPVRGGRGPER